MQQPSSHSGGAPYYPPPPNQPMHPGHYPQHHAHPQHAQQYPHHAQYAQYPPQPGYDYQHHSHHSHQPHHQHHQHHPQHHQYQAHYGGGSIGGGNPSGSWPPAGDPNARHPHHAHPHPQQQQQQQQQQSYNMADQSQMAHPDQHHHQHHYPMAPPPAPPQSCTSSQYHPTQPVAAARPPPAPPLDFSKLSEFIRALHLQITDTIIADAREWVLANVHSPSEMDAIATFFVAAITSKSAPLELKIKLLYLVTDLFHHASQRSMFGLIDAFDAHMGSLFRHIADTPLKQEAYQQLVTLLGFWRHNQFLSPQRFAEVDTIMHTISPVRLSIHDLENASAYHRLPAGLMVPLVKPSDQDYASIQPRDIVPLSGLGEPSDEMQAALSRFYTPDEQRLDDQGWERGVLSAFYDKKRANAPAPSSASSTSRSRRR
ncbi:hypothetical protein CAOG_06363 [Capsaspora owczarzaki ATCC 30864]|uniref:CID domain-containing protein n=1 Tax=Capsaspora owczarzaki (strain ATCC 30864) TaxID=595528 RepID=A0A0D2WTU5_CAPO3|nr:hypothetical protein CAOG_06363 [Capsaspora owczarzaki ATCC 30864]KJE95985.1 hypothetical protein CAOG_006363 [Capsaspora owczarzaki ATCC 30864]|eukprot:XP_004345112.1 hypothetical protein CAOG_06363 [Capsaspora owczarzaki ATCC 30864]